MIKIVIASLILSLNVWAAENVPAQENQMPAAVTTESLPPVAEATKDSKVVADATEKVELKPAAKQERNETKIPLNLDKPVTKENTEGSLFKLLFGFSVLGVFIAGAVFFLRKYAQPKNSKVQNQIKIISQHYLGPKKSLALVRVAGETVFIGITDNNINLLKTMSLLDEDIPENVPGNFDKVLNSTQTTFETKSMSASFEAEDEFSIKGIKDIVSTKLKNMRTLN